MPEQIEVVFFQRKPLPFHKSLEFIFQDVRARLSTSIRSTTVVCSVYSKGIVNRVRIMREAVRKQGAVNHITGDIHFAAILLQRQNTMLTVLDCGLLSNSSGLKHALLKYFWFTLPLKKCALVTVISAATKRELLRFTNYNAEDVYVVPVAISPAFQYAPRTFNRLKPVILLVGTMPNKNLDRVLEAVQGLSCILNIIGPLSDKIKETLHAFRIEYRNMVDISESMLVEQYRQCDLLSFVSTYEGFGMPIVEANATGRPVITSNILSMPEVAGRAACLVDPFDVAKIRAGIIRIIEEEDYRNVLVEEGLKNVSRFDPDVIAGQYFALYQRLAANPVAGG